MSKGIATEDDALTTSATPQVSPEFGVLLTVHEVAEILRVPASWVYERTRKRGLEQLPHLKIGKYVRFRLADVERYLETLRRA